MPEFRRTLTTATTSRPRATRHLTLPLFLATTIFLSACDGSSSGSRSNPPADTSALALDITFPPNGSSLEGLTSITVSGTLADSGDGTLEAADIHSFTVNEVPADVDFDLGRWQVEVPLRITEEMELTASLEGRSGQLLEAVVSVHNTALQGEYELLKLSAEGSSALVYGSGQLRRVDLASGQETPIVDGLAEAFRAPATGIRTDTTASNAYLLRWHPYSGNLRPDAYGVNLGDGSSERLGYLSYEGVSLGFDLDPVNRQLVMSRKLGDLHGIVDDRCSILTFPLAGDAPGLLVDTVAVSALPGAPPVPFCPGPIVIDAANNRAIVAADTTAQPDFFFPDPQAYGLYAYDLATGGGSVLSEAVPEQGPSLLGPKWLFLDAESERVLAVDDARILWVDLATGERAFAATDPDMPDGITDLDYDEAGQRLVIAHDLDRLSEFHLTSGERRELLQVSPGNSVGSGPPVPVASFTLTLADTERNRLYGFDRHNPQLLAIDLDTLERSAIATLQGGGGVVSAAVLDRGSRYLYYSWHLSAEIMRLDLETGTSEILTSSSIGSGTTLRDIRGLSVDEERGLLYATADIGNAHRNGLVSIDLATGQRKLLLEIPNIRFEPWAALRLNLYDAERDRVIATTQHGNVISINLHNGQRSVIYRRMHQEDPVHSLAWDSTPGRILIGVDIAAGLPLQVRSVDLDTGSYTVIQEDTVPFAFDPKRARLFSTEDLLRNGESGQVFAIDRYSGARSTIARSH